MEPDKVLFTVSDLASPWAFLDAHEKDLPSITEGYTVKIASSLYPERAFPGKITNISSTIDEKLRTIKVRVEIKNSSGFLKPNMYIQGRIEKGSGEQRFMAVPENAVQNLNGSKIVFVMEKDDIFFVRPVQLGRRAGDKRIISQGLNKGDRVVIEGAFQLKAELTKGTFGEAHAH